MITHTVMKVKLHRGIVFRSFVVTLLAFLVAAAGAISYTTYATAERATKLIDTRLGQLLETVQSTVKVACFLNDQDLALEVARGLLSNSEVLRVTINTSDKTLANVTREPSAQEQTEAQENLPVLERSVFSPFSAGEQVGTVVLTPNPAVITEMKQQDMLLAAKQLIWLLAFAALAITLALIVFVVRPISRVSVSLHTMQPLAGERLDIPPGYERTEIGRLVHDINDLADRLVAALGESREAREAAETASTAKSAFLANMSHEIRTPISAVLGLARIGTHKSQEAVAQRTFQQISDAGNHLLGVINDVLDISKIEAGKLSIETGDLSLAELIAEVMQLNGQRAEEKGLHLTSHIEPGLPAWIRGDEMRVRQILVNLLSNAIKFTERGEVKLLAERTADELRLTVSDPGIGLAPEAISRLFQPFEQADNSTTRKFGGTGLGLAISMQLAQLMGGRMEVSSQLGSGSRFSLVLPLVEVAAPESPRLPVELPAETARGLAGLRVLAAEDIEVNRVILDDILSGLGALSTFAVNGRLAVDQVSADPAAFDVVLMDVQMPVMDGYEATRLIRTLAPQLPVIGLTAHAMAEERAKCLAAGMVDHVTKPIEPRRLITALLRATPGLNLPSVSLPAVEASPSAVPPAPTFEPSSGEIDWPALYARFNGRDALIHRLAKTMLDSHQEAAEKFHRAMAERDFEALVFLSHGLKGTAGNFSALRVQNMAQQVLEAARLNDPQAFVDAEPLVAGLERVLNELRHYQLAGDAATVRPAYSTLTSGEENR